MLLSDLFDVATLDSDIEGGFVRMQTHPQYPHLGILNYTEKAQFDNHWTPVTLRCRGLVFDGLTEQVIALPFPKFFNYDQHGPSSALGNLPPGRFDIFDKLDGSLGIFFRYDDSWHVATRGSFTSEQAQWAQSWLYDRIVDGTGQFLDPSITYLAEIIYPANRVVVDYRGLSDCVLLGGFNVTTGQEEPLRSLRENWPGTSVRTLFGWASLAALAAEAADSAISGTQREGYVVRFRDNGQRAKIKYADYKRIHGLFTETNEKTIWTFLSAGGSLADVMSAKDVPDELYAWASEIADDLFQRHDDLLLSVNDAYQSVLLAAQAAEGGFTRKTFAQIAQRTLKPHLLKGVFMALDANHVKLSRWAWRQLEPRFGGRRPGGRPADEGLASE